MDPISFAAIIGIAVAAGTTVVAGLVALFGEDEHKQQINHRAKDARRRMDQTSQEYLRDVDHLLRRK